MTAKDAILEAEATIRGLAKELARMKDAATLLEDGKNQTAAVLKASEAVIVAAGQFTDAGAEIVRQFKAVHIKEDLEKIRLSQEANERQGAQIQKAIENVGVKVTELQAGLKAQARSDLRIQLISLSAGILVLGLTMLGLHFL